MEATTTATENEAKALFRSGIEYEREGNHNKATRCYKRALKLDAGVEKKIADEEDEDASCSMNTPMNALLLFNNDNSNESEDKYNHKEDLFLRLQRITGQQTCVPEHSQQATHFSSLPTELVLYIFRWVVSNDLDLCTLEQCAAVCRGWYLCARDPDLWRRACSKSWPSNAANDVIQYGNNWRLMFLLRPNVLTFGCYICKITYVRQGEESFRDNTNGPSFDVVYYRYLRFFSNGHVLMVVSHDPPSKILHKLQTRENAPFKVCPGHYELSGNKLFVTLESKDNDFQIEINKKVNYKNTIQKWVTTYKMVFAISSYKFRLNWKLQCTKYKVVQSRVNKVIVTKYNITNNSFPPFIFSRVKSYANESEHIL